MTGKAKSSRPRGRPRGTFGQYKPFLKDPDRYAIALAEAYIGMGLSQRQAFDLAAGVFGGELPEPCDENSMPKCTWRTPQMVTVDGRSSTLRKKARRANAPEEVRWRTNMALAFAILLSAKEHEKGAMHIRAAATFVGELPWAEAVLIPALEDRFAHPTN